MAELWSLQISLADQGLSGREALDVRHAIEDQIEAANVGEIKGGGTAMDGTATDIQVAVKDSARAKAFFDNFLDHCGLKEHTTISVSQ